MKRIFTCTKSKLAAAAVLLITMAGNTASAQTVLYMQNASSGPPNATFADTASKTVYFDDASTATIYAPSTSVTFTYTNQVFSSLEGIPNGNGMQFNANASGIGNNVNSSIPSYNNRYPNLLVGAPVDGFFTTQGAQPISVGSNRAVTFATMPDALLNADGSTNYSISGTHKYGEVTVYFNRPVSNPILHFNGLGGTSYFYISSGVDGITNTADDTVRCMGWSTEFRLKSYTGAGATLSLLSGDTALAVHGDSILNIYPYIGSASSGGNVTTYFNLARYAAAGSIKVTGSNITSITFEVLFKGDGGTYQLRGGAMVPATAPVPQWSNQANLIFNAYNPNLNQQTVAADVYQVGISLLKPVTVSGNVFNDPDQGNVNNSSGNTNSVPSGLFAFLLDNNGNVADKVAVGTDGAYQFSEVYAGTYTVQISTNSALTRGLGAPPAAPGASVTSGYNFTGTFNGPANTGNSGASGTSTAFIVTPNANITDINFGIRQFTPFGCNNAQAFVSKGPNANVQIYVVNPNTGTNSVVASLSGIANGIAYNPVNNLLYFLYAPYSGTGPLPQPNLYQVDATGAVTQLPVPNLSAVTFSNPPAGTVTADGYYIAGLAAAATNASYIVIDVNPSRSTYLQIVDPSASYAVATAPYYKTAGAAFNISDFAYNSVNSLLYGIIGNGTDAGKIETFNPVTGAVTVSVQAQLTSGVNLGVNVYGSAFFDATGRLYTQVNTNGIFYATNITTGMTVQLATTGSATNTDGAACPTATVSDIILGNVYDDANGLQGTPANTVDGTPTNIGGALNAILYDVTTGLIAAVTPVAANGTYSFGATPGHNYNVYLTTNTATVGSAVPPMVALPAGWVNTGEHLGTNAGSDNTTDGILSLGTVNTDVTNANFGVEQTPKSDSKSTIIPSPLPNSFATLDGNGSHPPLFTGSDPEDQVNSGTLSAKTIAITSLPAQGQLFYNGVQITLGADGINPPSATNPYVITNFNPSLMQVRFTGLGYTSLSFTYAYVDAAGRQDPAPATYALNWNTPLPLQLLSFTGTTDDCTSKLSWTTANEQNVSHFDVQYSTDGLAYTTVGSVNSKGVTAGSSYAFDYNSPKNGKALYRLQITEVSGSYTVSNNVTLNVQCDNRTIMLSPNPTNSIVTINGLNTGDRIQVYAADGRLIVSELAISSQQQIDLHTYINGIYQMIILAGNMQMKSIRIIKQ